MPNPANPQNLNRFGYVLNNPVNFNDPLGHEPKGPGSCYDSKAGVCVDTAENPSSGLSIDDQLSKIGIETDDDMPEKYKGAIIRAALDIGVAFAKSGQNAWNAYQSMFPSMNFVYDPNCVDCRNKTACGNQMSGSVVYNGEEVKCTPGGALTVGTNQITIAALSSSYSDARVKNIVHEFGHVLNNLKGGNPVDSMPSVFYDNRSLILHPNPGYLLWQQNTTRSNTETFGDMFVAQVYGVWNTNIDPANPNIVVDAQDWMNNWTP